MKNPDLTLLRRNLLIQYCRAGVLYGSEDHIVWCSRDQGRSWSEVCRLPAAAAGGLASLRDVLLRSALVRNIRRNIGINNVVVLKSGTIIIQYDKIYRYDGTGSHAVPVFDFAEDMVNGPLKNGLAYDEGTDCLYFGEYQSHRPWAVRIFRGRDDGRLWEPCYCFAPGRIRHVHAICPDPYRQRLWICSGDSDAEAGLFYTDDGFKTVSLLAGGDQSWRMVSLISTPDAIIWGSDAGKDASAAVQNAIYRLDPVTMERQRLAEIDKPAYYSCQGADGRMFMGTTYEPGMKRQADATADIWSSADGLLWEKIASFPYAPSPRNYGTKYATVHLPLGERLRQGLCFSLLNTAAYDFVTLHLMKP